VEEERRQAASRAVVPRRHANSLTARRGALERALRTRR
jgi:hypothetical protein